MYAAWWIIGDGILGMQNATPNRLQNAPEREEDIEFPLMAMKFI